jgi:hypothetical protein
MKNNFLLFIVFLFVVKCADAQEDSSKPETSVNIHHFVTNNSFQYLQVETKIKANKKWQPLKGEKLQVFLDSAKDENLIAKTQTDSDGKVKVMIPPGLQSAWNASPTHKFIAVTNDGTESEIEISKAKILIDTTNVDSTRTVNVQVMKWENNSWMPEKGVELKIGVKRLGGDLKIGDEESYTTDSLGSVAAEFKLDSLPGDEKSNLTLIARIDDNDKYGSLSVEKEVPWGIRASTANEFGFGQRALWAARFKAPVWLMFMAYSIMATVWGIIVYLIFGIVKISKLGKKETQVRQTASINI